MDESLNNESQLNKVATQLKLKLMSAKIKTLKKKTTKLSNDRKKLIARLKRNLSHIIFQFCYNLLERISPTLSEPIHPKPNLQKSTPFNVLNNLKRKTPISLPPDPPTLEAIPEPLWIPKKTAKRTKQAYSLLP